MLENRMGSLMPLILVLGAVDNLKLALVYHRTSHGGPSGFPGGRCGRWKKVSRLWIFLYNCHDNIIDHWTKDNGSTYLTPLEIPFWWVGTAIGAMDHLKITKSHWLYQNIISSMTNYFLNQDLFLKLEAIQSNSNQFKGSENEKYLVVSQFACTVVTIN